MRLHVAAKLFKTFVAGLVVLACVLLGLTPHTAHAATFTVNTTVDTDDGACDADCSLREAITAANGDAAADIIRFNLPGSGPHTINLNSALPDLSTDITIAGPGPDLLTIQRSSAAGTPDFRIFMVSAGALVRTTATISGLTIANGKDDLGGGIYNIHSSLTLTDMVVQNNEGGAGGGGVYNAGRIITDEFGNETDLTGRVTIDNSHFTGNSAFTGGAIFNNAQYGPAEMSVSNSTFTENSARMGGGAVANDWTAATAEISRCIFEDNAAVHGGGIWNSNGRVSVSNSWLTLNSAVHWGGAIFNSSYNTTVGLLTVSNSTLSLNTAQFGGGIHNDGDSGFGSAFVQADISNSTFTGNVASGDGGGIYNIGDYTNPDDLPVAGAVVNITSSTFSANSADGSGGAIYNTGDPYEETVNFPGFQGAGVSIVNTILHQGTASSANVSNNDHAAFTSLGYNLSSDDGSGFLTATGDQINTDPRLDPLQQNGGPTMTHALLEGSPAIDQGKTDLSTDQRGEPRPFDDPTIAPATGGDNSDIGAYEVQSVLNTAPTANDDTYITDENTPLSVPAPGVLDNDTDNEDHPLTASLVSGPANGSLTLNADGSFLYTPNANYNGSDAFTYQANDGTADSNTATVNIAVNAVNDDPDAVDDNASTTATQSVTIAVLSNDTDGDGDALSVMSVTQGAHGSATRNADNTVTYTPSGTYLGSDSFTYTISDGNGGTDTATVTVRVLLPNSTAGAKVTGDGAIATAQNGSGSFTVNAQFKKDGTTDGQFSYDDSRNGVYLHSTELLAIVAHPDDRRWVRLYYRGSWNTAGSHLIVVHVFDGSPGQANDSIEVSVDGALVAEGVLTRGNIQVHKVK